MSKKRNQYLGAGIAFVVLIIFFLNMEGYFGHRIDPGNQASPPQDLSIYDTVDVVKETVEEYETAAGSIASRKETVISSKIPATVKSILVKPGAKVAQNDLLIELDQRDLDAKLGQAKSALQAAQAASEQANSSYQRYQSLIKSGSATQAEFENAEAQHHMASAKVNEAKNAIQELDVMRGYAQIRAPYSGVIDDKLIEVGALAAPGVPLLKMQDSGDLRFEVYIPESRKEGVNIGTPIMIGIDSTKEQIRGTIEEIIPSSDPRSRSYLIRISLESAPGIRPGMFGRCYLPIKSKEMILIDQKAIYRVGQLEMVRVLKDARAETRMIRTGLSRGDSVEILSGLEAGEKILVMKG